MCVSFVLSSVTKKVPLICPKINVNGPLLLFQATYPLLKESKAPKFVALTSPMGSIHTGASWPGGLYNYGASKAAMNWVVRKLHHDFQDIGESCSYSP